MKNAILIVDNEEKFCKIIKAALDLESIASAYVTSGEAAIKWLKANQPYLVLTDLRMEGMDGLELLRQIKKKDASIDVLIMTAFASQKTAVEALKIGATDYLIKPFEMDELVLRIRRIQEQRKIIEENRKIKASSKPPVFFDQIVGRSEKMKRVFQLIQKGAATDSTVLIRGESGTGKELVAEALHNESPRCEKSFMAINCAALPDTLLESELFGYEKGAFTGASSTKSGKIEAANQGTIFLDEIGDMSLSTQAKLLRVLQNKEIFRLGGNDKIKVDVRVIAATHQDLEKMVEEGKFRQDLFYRLNIFPITIPPLRERKEDIPELVNHFLKLNRVSGIDRNAMRLLMDYDWPGNIRELQNVIERAAILTDAIITEDDLPELSKRTASNEYDFQFPENGIKLDEFEQFLIRKALELADGNKTRASELLGITRRRLYSIMERFGING